MLSKQLSNPNCYFITDGAQLERRDARELASLVPELLARIDRDAEAIAGLRERLGMLCSGAVETFESQPGHSFTCQPAQGKHGPVRFYEDVIDDLRERLAKYEQEDDWELATKSWLREIGGYSIPLFGDGRKGIGLKAQSTFSQFVLCFYSQSIDRDEIAVWGIAEGDDRIQLLPTFRSGPSADAVVYRGQVRRLAAALKGE